MKEYVQLTYIVIGLEVPDDGPVLFGKAQPVVRKEVALFVTIDDQKKRNRKYTSLITIYIQTAFLKATKSFQCDFVPWQRETIAK